ncbi:hypothetical protein AVEN_100408-1 [Araneus ventricosus]|uniref:Uncharacterized protein n=1 Tax=Araneus ventricosus TaxID=182803 RepID=A0A4Y2JXC1_ARAVE|nr:hypothetical protein AVEN_100408-1 [Araneus ventricosus]
MPKRSCKFTEDLQNEFPFLKKLALFNKAILGIEKDNTTAFEVAEAHKALKRNLTEGKASNFVPMGAKNIYRNLDEQVRNSVKEEFDGLYERCIAYLDLWENSFGNAEQFSSVNLTKTNAVDWENAETSAEIINNVFFDVPI